VSFLSGGNSTLQLATDPQMRGRVMALWSVAFLGSTPIGGPLIGWITADAGARVGLAVGAVSCFVAGGFGWIMLRRHRAGAAVTPDAGTVVPPIPDEALLED
jgi:MFS family permease